MDQWLRARAALLKDLGLIFSTHKVVQNHVMELDTLVWPLCSVPGMDMGYKAYMKAKHPYT